MDSGRDSALDLGADSGVILPYTLYVKTMGKDTNSGKSPVAAVKTLARVQKILQADHPNRDVEVRIEQGTYTGQSVTWTYYNPFHKIAFMPIDYHGGGVNSIAGLPVFDGRGAGAFLGLHASDGKPTRLEFVYLEIRGYQKFGILFGGNRDDFANGWNGYNRIYGCRLTKIGSYDNPGAHGYGALDFVNSRHNTIRNNHFVNVRNASGGEGLMHAVYLAHGSSDNQITANRFTGISGDPIRARDESNRNHVADNVFKDTGSGAFISDWWCDKSQISACTKVSGECPSWENDFRNNEVHCGYGGKTVSLFTYYQGKSYVPSWCVNHSIKDGWKRLYTSGNQGTCP
ncbi:MAG: right-handed parallel beta-helix repeat-containing protein [Deltaproteobacteria bacterium]|nr:right-handed parallel beta-helix repeat-containing protein [Deltaproteobacteria bacterium]